MQRALVVYPALAIHLLGEDWSPFIQTQPRAQSPEPKEEDTRSRSFSVATSEELLMQLNEELDGATSATGPFFDANSNVDTDVDEETDGEDDDVGAEEKDAPMPETPDSPSAALACRDTSLLYVVEKFVAERQTPGGLEIPVQWEGYPDEED
jgi:hypothetical protein